MKKYLIILKKCVKFNPNRRQSDSVTDQFDMEFFCCYMESVSNFLVLNHMEEANVCIHVSIRVEVKCKHFLTYRSLYMYIWFAGS